MPSIVLMRRCSLLSLLLLPSSLLSCASFLFFVPALPIVFLLLSLCEIFTLLFLLILSPRSFMQCLCTLQLLRNSRRGVEFVRCFELSNSLRVLAQLHISMSTANSCLMIAREILKRVSTMSYCGPVLVKRHISSSKAKVHATVKGRIRTVEVQCSVKACNGTLKVIVCKGFRPAIQVPFHLIHKSNALLNSVFHGMQLCGKRKKQPSLCS
mmetsp:Transcript_7117/g.12492  ORF Transcript_7117/g.12492 Transcript_7117/m.12492 type:complete len:211 (-) Transcript_7117:1176-1808(-)